MRTLRTNNEESVAMVRLTLNNKSYNVDADPNTPLLWAIR